MFKINKNKVLNGFNSSKVNKIVKKLLKFKKLKNNEFKTLLFIKAAKKTIF